MRHRFTLIVFTLLALGTSSMVWAADDKKPTGGPQMEPHALIKTKFGEIEIKFFPKLDSITGPSFIASFLAS